MAIDRILHQFTNVLQDDFKLEPFSVSRGRYRIPSGPGLGVTLDESAIDRYRIA